MAFVIVNFVVSNEVAIVPCSWLFEDMCYWPPKSMSSHILPLIEKEIALSPSESWELFKVQCFGLFETYSEARRKLPVAEEKSDLNTTDPEECGRGKRQKKKRRISSSSESEDFTDILKLPNPPELHFKKNKENTRPSIENVNCQNQIAIQDSCGSFTLSTQKSLKNKRSGSFLNADQMRKSVDSPLSPSLLSGNASCSSTKIHESPQLNIAPGIPCGTPDISTNKLEGYLKAIMRDIKIIKTKQKYLEDNIEVIMKTMMSMQSPPNNDEEFDSIHELIQLCPVSNDHDLNIMEESLQDQQITNKMILYLKRVGGYTFEQNVKFMLCKLLTNDFAVNFSYLGARGKRSFKSLHVCKIIYEAFRSEEKWKAATDFEFDKITSNWLRHAKARSSCKK